MRNDGQCWIHIPVDLTDPMLSVDAAAMVNQLHALLNKPSVVTGAPNPYYLPVAQIGIATGSSIDRSQAMAVCGPITNTVRVPLDFVDLVVAIGGDVEGLPFWFELADIAVECPLSTTTPKETWEVWGTVGESHKPVKYGTKWYRSNAVGMSGAMLNASQVTAIRQLVISQERFLAIQKENTPLRP